MKRLLKIILALVLASVSALSLVACVDPNNTNNKEGLKYTTNKNGEYVVYQYVEKEGETELDIEAAIREDSKDENAVVVEIKSGAFKNTDNLQKIIVPSTVTKMGHAVFNNVKNLKELTIPFVGGLVKADAYPNQTDGAVDKATDEQRTFAYIFGHDEYDGGARVSITHPSDQTTTTFYIPATLEKITINPKDNYEIPMYSFDGFTFELEIELSEKVVGIGEGAFLGCTKMYDFTIPTSVKTIYKQAFYGCTRLNTINYLGDATAWGEIDVLQEAFESTSKTFKVLDNLGAEIDLGEE